MSLLSLLLAVFLVALPVRAEEPPAEPPDPYAQIEDPRRFEELADAALEAGKTDEARDLFGRMLDRQEAKKYLGYRDVLRDALVLERMGDVEGSAAKYREAFGDDVLRAVQVLRILSVHPDRDAIATEGIDWVRGHLRALHLASHKSFHTPR